MQTDLPGKNLGFLGIFSFLSLRHDIEEILIDVPEEGKNTHTHTNNRGEATGRSKDWKPKVELLCLSHELGKGLRCGGVAVRKKVESDVQGGTDGCRILVAWKPTNPLLELILSNNGTN